MRLPDIPPAEINPKRHDADGIRASIGEHGLAELPLLDERTGRLVAGHGRIDQLRAMRAAGDNPPADVDVDTDGVWLVPIQRGWASKSDVHAKAYLASSNKLAENGGWDLDELAPMLVDVEEAGRLETTGFDQAEMDALLHADDDLPPGGGDSDNGPTEVAHGVIVICTGEHTQDALLHKLQGQGYNAKTLAAARVRFQGDDA